MVLDDYLEPDKLQKYGTGIIYPSCYRIWNAIADKNKKMCMKNCRKKKSLVVLMSPQFMEKTENEPKQLEIQPKKKGKGDCTKTGTFLSDLYISIVQ